MKNKSISQTLEDILSPYGFKLHIYRTSMYDSITWKVRSRIIGFYVSNAVGDYSTVYSWPAHRSLADKDKVDLMLAHIIINLHKKS